MQLIGTYLGSGLGVFSSTKRFILVHKIISIILLVMVVGGGYWAYTTLSSTDGETRYVLGTVEKGTIVASISASGQVSASNQVEIQPKASGEVMYVGVKKGQSVKTGAVIAQLDSTDAQKAVRDAETDLETAKLDLEELQQPADKLALLQADNALVQAKTSLAKAYDSSFNTVSDAFLDLPEVMAGLDAILYDDDVSISGSQDNIDAYRGMIDTQEPSVAQFGNDAEEKYKKAREAFDATFLKYRSLTRTSDKASIEALANETYETAKKIADALKSTNDFLEFVSDALQTYNRTKPTILAEHQSLLASHMASANTNLASLLSVTDSITTAEFSIEEKTEELAELKAGADALDLRAAQLTLRQREEAVQSAKEALADYSIRAPFDGIIASLDVQKGETVSSGAIATLITNQKVATLSVNEVDAAKIKVGDKATLTFDAIEELTLTGEVAEIDTIGAVSQGVVSYELQIVFDTQDERVKPGMTVNAAIMTDTKQDVLVVPSSAVKTQNGISYVQVFNPALSQTGLPAQAGGTQGVTSDTTPQQVEVEIGISDDTNIEILSGIEEGQQVVTRTISGTASNTTTTGGATNNRGGGGFGGPPGAIRF